jgi:hypothetical protein
MQLKYVGPKPLISHTGIEFDNNKEDKYALLNIVVQLLKALDHDYFDNKTYTYDVTTKRLNSEELHDELKVYCPNLDELLEKRFHTVSESIEEEIARAKRNKFLDDESKEVLIANIKIMKDYMIQRAVNKSAYYCAVNKLAEFVKKDHIDHIVVPMFQKFAHVLHSVQGVLREQRFPIDTKIDIYEQDGKLLAKLQAINILDEK